MKTAAEAADEWNKRDRVRVADAKARGVRVCRRGDKDPRKKLGFYGKSVLHQLFYFDTARAQKTDCFHHVAGTVKAIFGTILDRGDYQFTKSRREYCVREQKRFRNLKPGRISTDAKGVQRQKFPRPS